MTRGIGAAPEVCILQPWPMEEWHFMPIGPAKADRSEGFYYVLYHFSVILIKQLLFYMEIPSELFRIMKIFKNDPCLIQF